MKITEIAADVYRLSLYVPEINLQFIQFLVRDESPLLFHTGMKAIFPEVREAVSKIINPQKIRYIGFSHFEADECGSLNEWLSIAPNAEPVCSVVGALVSVNDFSTRPAKGMTDGEKFSTGKYSFRFVQTPHVPHCWEAGLLFEETQKILFSSDLLHQNGDLEPFTHSDLTDRVRQTLLDFQSGPLASYMPFSNQTESILHKLAELEPTTIATMHGSTYIGNGKQAINNLAGVMKEVLCN
jgi:flavorubredoxin